MLSEEITAEVLCLAAHLYHTACVASERSVQCHASSPLYSVLQQFVLIVYLIRYAAWSGSELHFS